ncbi:MAG: hypothetical protein A2Z16_13640 [Chloroflexi bacterium RBG_16_54_18]|nr:MAG: hypothetical protein A2Z16_13640 [Chloroflexi bacterium RBG_16_54_18]
MFSSLRFRLWLTYVLVAGIVIGIAGIVLIIYLIRNPAADRRELQRLKVVSGLIVNRGANFFQALGNGSSESVQKAAERVDRQLGVRTAYFNGTGDLLADSRLGLAADLPDWTLFSSLNTTSFRDSNRRQWLFVVTPLESGDYLLLALPRIRTPIWALVRDEILPPFGRGVLLALFLSLIMAIWISEWVSAPLKRMAAAAHEISVKKFSRIKLEGPREVKDLAGAFNEMGDRVQAYQRSQQDFVANVSHDLKTPLTSIQGFAQAIMDGTAEGPDAVTQAAAVIYDEAGRMHRMVLDLLELARYDSGMAKLEYSEFDPEKLLLEVVEEFEPLAAKLQVNLKFESGAVIPSSPTSAPVGGSLSESIVNKPVLITADADQLKQVISNLIENALKFTPAGGKVLAGSAIMDRWIEIRVKDSGPGIPPEEVERVFERFYQMDKSRSGGSQRGVGLGLAIAREIVQAHGGSIFVVNKPAVRTAGQEIDLSAYAGIGCEFIVQLPLTQPESQNSSSQKSTNYGTAASFTRRL